MVRHPEPRPTRSPAPAADARRRNPLVRRALPWLALAAAAVVVKGTVIAQLHAHPLLQPTGELDAAAYASLARGVLADGLFAGSQAFFVSPFYVGFLAAVSWLTGDLSLAPRIVQGVLGVGTVLLIAGTARRWFGAAAGWIAGVLAVGTGLFSFYEALILQASVDPFLTALSLYLVTRSAQDDRPMTGFAAGLAFGALALNRPNTLPAALVAAALSAGRGLTGRAQTASPSGAASGGSIRRVTGVAPAAALVAGLALAIAPVTLRNFVAAGDFVPISSHGGLNFYIGNNAAADGSYHAVPGITPSILGQAIDATRVAEAAVGHPLGPRAVSTHFSSLAWRSIQEHPVDAARLFARKLALTFNSGHLTLTASYPFYAYDERTLLRLLVVGPGLLVPLGLVGLLLRGARHRSEGFSIWASFVPVYGVFVAVFFVSSRYRLPLLVPLATSSGGAVVWLVTQLRTRAFRSLRAPVAGLILTATLANWNFGFDDGRSAEQTEMVLHLVDTRQDDQARTLLARVEAKHRQRGDLSYRVGLAYQRRGDAALAVPLLAQAIAATGGAPVVRLALGQALLDSGRPAEALPRLEAALAAGDDASRRRSPWPAREPLLATGPAPWERWPPSPSLTGSTRRPSWRWDGGALRTRRPSAGRVPLVESHRARPGQRRRLRGVRTRARVAESRRRGHRRAGDGLPPFTGRASAAHLNLAALLAESGRLAEARPHAMEALRLQPRLRESAGVTRGSRRQTVATRGLNARRTNEEGPAAVTPPSPGAHGSNRSRRVTSERDLGPQNHTPRRRVAVRRPVERVRVRVR